MGMSDTDKAGLITKGVGSVAGTIGGGISAGNKSKANKATIDEYLRQQAQIQKDLASNSAMREGQVTGAYAPQLQGYGENSQAYFDKLKDTDFSKYDVQAPGDYTGPTIAELIASNYNPQAKAMVDAAGNAVQGSAANAGNLFSGVNAGNIAKATATEQGNQYNEARNAATQQYGQKYKEFTDKFANILAATGANKANAQANLNTQGTLYKAQTDAFGNQQQELGGIRSANDQAMFASKGGVADATAQRKGIGGYWSNFAGGALSGLAKGLGG